MRKDQIRKYEALLKECIRSSKEFRAYQKNLSKSCDHPDRYVMDWQWEHDNGYGRQTMIDGKRCGICGATKNWVSDTYWHKNVSVRVINEDGTVG